MTNRYIAFLRAINVGKRTVQMARLREIASGLGLSDVATCIASGNLIPDGAIGRRARTAAHQRPCAT